MFRTAVALRLESADPTFVTVLRGGDCSTEAEGRLDSVGPGITPNGVLGQASTIVVTTRLGRTGGTGMAEDLERNRLLAQMTATDRERLLPHLERVRTPLRSVICKQGEQLRYVYFPIDGVVSAIIVLSDAAALEVIAIGNEGMAGSELLARESASAYTLIQQVEGESVRVPGEVFRSLLQDSAALHRLLERYVFTLLRNTTQNAACNLHHGVEERMCRWLLATSDRVGRDDFYITQEFLGEMLGVRRQSVNLTAGALQKSGLIQYRRGNLQILDHERLEQAACECYAITKSFYEQMMQISGNGM